MATIHFEAQWKGNRGAAPHCKRFAARPSGGRTTKALDQVNCRNCAKALGVTPAAKPQSKNLGTCPCCFNRQKTLSGNRMVHHGYERPGYGYNRRDQQNHWSGRDGAGAGHGPPEPRRVDRERPEAPHLDGLRPSTLSRRPGAGCPWRLVRDRDLSRGLRVVRAAARTCPVVSTTEEA